jgi:hypothetical protein
MCKPSNKIFWMKKLLDYTSKGGMIVTLVIVDNSIV